jgi:hypothetical protein
VSRNRVTAADVAIAAPRRRNLSPARPARDTALYAFGDSYSAIGAGYTDGNGPTAVAYLGWLMGVPVMPSTAAKAAGRVCVRRERAGTVRRGTPRQGGVPRYGMMNQVRDFAAREVRRHRLRAADDAFFLAGGLNDGRRETAFTLDNLRQELQILRELGGRLHDRSCRRRSTVRGGGPKLNPAYQQFVRQEATAAGIDVAESLGRRLRRGDRPSGGASSTHQRLRRPSDLRSGSNARRRSGDLLLLP